MNIIKNIFAISRVLMLAAAAVLTAAPASADVHLRVESRPSDGPIDAFVTVTDENGRAISGLTATNFSVTLDGAPLNTAVFGLPPAQDAAQKKSIVFVVGSFFAKASLDAVASFIRHMQVGEYAAIAKYGHRYGDPTRPPEVLPLTQIDGGAGTDLLLEALHGRAIFNASRAGVLDALMLAVDQFATPPVVLPDGPKAIVLVGPGTTRGSPTQSDVVAFANATGIPIFTVGIGDADLGDYSTSLLTSLAEDTGGAYVRDEPDLALAAVALLLKDAYRLSLPQARSSDCYPHVLEVTVSGLGAQNPSASLPFARCDTTPEPFEFATAIGVTPDSHVISNAVTIMSIESPVGVAVYRGVYSIGCGATFTSVPGFLSRGDNVCVRHTASENFLTSRTTTLVVGGVWSHFVSETSAAPPSPPPATPATPAAAVRRRLGRPARTAARVRHLACGTSQREIIATTRTGPPEPPSIFIGSAISRVPVAGSASRLVRFSRPATFAAPAMRCTGKSCERP